VGRTRRAGRLTHGRCPTSVRAMANKTWFITGTSRGFGREWAIAALERDDRVAGTARDAGTLDDLKEKYGDARIVDADTPLLRAFFGSAPLRIAERDYESRLSTWREWQPVAELAQGGN
jgi:NAD(P)-dependent dehydrogenase (short-subunit alcohol dehydrogenase family)